MPAEQSSEDTEPTRFSVFIAQHAKGRTDEELGTLLQELIQAARDSGKPGSVTLKINLKPINDSTFEITDQIAVKKPALERKKSIWFADDTGRLSRDDPNQLPLTYQERTR